MTKIPDRLAALTRDDLVWHRAILLDALTEACAAMAVGMTVAHKTPGSGDALATIQTAYSRARDAVALAKSLP